MKKLIVVADWAADSITCQEIRSTIEGYVDNPTHPHISFVSSTPSTIHTAYLISQVVETEERYGRPLDTVIFQGSDSVADNPEALAKIWGHLTILRLKSGVHIIGANSGFVFSLVKAKIDAVFHYPGFSESGSFRARDTFARVVAHLMDSKQDELELEESHTNLIPELQEHYVAHIDSFGNIITTAPESVIQEQHKYGDQVTIMLNGATRTAQYATNLFEGFENNLVIYPGTSGPQDDPYLEISAYSDISTDMTHTGFSRFNNPAAGSQIIIK